MEWIGWLSLAIVIAGLVYFGVSAFSTFKSMKPKIDRLKEAQSHIQTQTDKIKGETDELKVHQEQIMADVDHAKQAVTLTVNEAKQIPNNAVFLAKTTMDSVKNNKTANS
ncbi:DUF948 domain-containing protein [Domibacillus epiphyticus]|uniref:DUF948 domain-containing protein n=1 Tax=Domibacillus epiphyticus TaxID=1714355 RepID=A0A1V2AB49_9BACI|nr:hypothetical protein [Domibacillus epiphyticus]OMP68062.1 hypothetical protein BTO28_03680 [Domibacillus epiphyticus]